MKKVFGEINLTWTKVIIMAIVMGLYTAIVAMLPITKDTSFSDLAVTFEVWIFFGIFIIMNSKSAKDSALKCLVFFVISQPLIYLIQDLINHSNLFFLYYRNWVGWTIACIPMGFIGYYMKKDKWWGLLILTPIMLLLGFCLNRYIGLTIFSFPRHLLTVLFCIATLIIYPLVIFKNKKIRIVGEVIDCIIIVVVLVISIMNPPVYNTDLITSGEEYNFDDSYKVYLTNNKFGEVNIRYEDDLDCWMVGAKFKKAGKTTFVLESPKGEKTTFDLEIKIDSYSIKENK